MTATIQKETTVKWGAGDDNADGAALGTAPASLTNVSYQFTEDGETEQANFLTDTRGDLFEIDDPEDKETFTYTYAQQDETSAIIRVSFITLSGGRLRSLM